jgi:hypothetical protein
MITRKATLSAGLSVLALAALAPSVPSRAADTATDAPPSISPPPADPHDIEGVWKPGRSGPPPGQRAGAAPGGGGPGPGGTFNVAGSDLVCAPLQRLGGAGGGMSNLWVEGPKEIVMISEEDQDVRKIYLQAHHPKNPTPQPNGNSIGHWEGKTLVVDSIAFSDASGKDKGEHIVERIQKQGNQMVDHATITANGTTTQQIFVSDWRPDLQVWENVCEEGYSKFQIINGKLDDTNS